MSGERVADTMDAAVAALRREQILVTRINAGQGEGRGRAAKAKAGKLGKKVGEEPGGVHAAVLGDDRRRPAARAVPRHSRHPGGGQELRRRHPADAGRRRRRRVAGRRDAQASEDVRSAVHEHDRGRRGRRHPRHDSQAAGHLHREGGQARRPGQVGDDLSGRGDRHRRRGGRRDSVEGHSDLRRAVRRPGRRAAAADAVS